MLKKTLVAVATLSVVGIVAKLILDFVSNED